MNLNQIVWLDFDYMNKHYEGEAIPSSSVLNNSHVPAFDVYFNNEYSGTMFVSDNNWISDCHLDYDMGKIIRRKILSCFNS